MFQLFREAAKDRFRVRIQGAGLCPSHHLQWTVDDADNGDVGAPSPGDNDAHGPT